MSCSPARRYLETPALRDLFHLTIDWLDLDLGMAHSCFLSCVDMTTIDRHFQHILLDTYTAYIAIYTVYNIGRSNYLKDTVSCRMTQREMNERKKKLT